MSDATGKVNVPRAERVFAPVRAVLDPRVLQSAVWGGRSSTLVIDAWLEGRVHLCVTEQIMAEYFAALRRMLQVPLGSSVADHLRTGESVRAFIVPRASGVPEDRLIACAQAATAESVVTHDETLLDLGQVGSVRMETPGEFVRRHLS